MSTKLNLQYAVLGWAAPHLMNSISFISIKKLGWILPGFASIAK